MVYLAFYYGPGNWITKAIRTLTTGPYSHVELLFSNGWCFSASGRRREEYWNVRWKLQCLHEWDLVPLRTITKEQEEQAILLCSSLEGLPFDWSGLLGFLLPFLPDRQPNKWYCSAICLMVMQECFNLFQNVSRKIHPNGLYRLVTD